MTFLLRELSSPALIPADPNALPAWPVTRGYHQRDNAGQSKVTQIIHWQGKTNQMRTLNFGALDQQNDNIRG